MYLNPKVLSLLKTLTMITSLLFLVLIIFNFYHNKMVEKKENRQTMFVMSGMSGKLSRLTPPVIDKHLVENDCWVTKVSTDRMGNIISVRYFCFNDMSSMISNHYNKNRDFKSTKIDLIENDLESKSAYLMLGKDKFCSANTSHRFCAKKTRTS